MFFRRAFPKNHQPNYGKEMFEETSSDLPSPPSPVKIQKRRASIEEKQSRGLSVLQLTPLWEHIIRTNSMPRSIVISDVFDEFYERLHDPEWQVRQHALRVLVDVLIVMGQQADYHIQNLVHPLVDNLGHIAPAVRKGALDALRVYVAQTAMPETVMLDIMNYGMDRPVKDPFGGRMTVAVMLALPALILPILITPKRAYVVKAVMEALANKMVKITYQEIALKILLKLKDMVGPNEFTEAMPSNVKKDFELLCKVYGLPKSPTFRDSSVDLHVPAHDPKKPWASRFVPRKDIQGNVPSSHAPMNYQDKNPDGSKFFGNNYDATYPFERTRLSNNLGTPKRAKSPRSTSGGILRSSSDNSLSVDYNGNSSGSESGGSMMSLRTQNNTAANSQTVSVSHELDCNGGGSLCEKVINGKVIMETEIKITPETAVTMRILEQNPSTQTDDSDDEGTKRIVTDFSAPYPVTPMRPRNYDDNNNSLRFSYDSAPPKNGRRVRFGGEIVKMRTPDSDTVDQSDDNEPKILNLPLKRQKESLNYSDNSSVSSDNSTTNEYIKQANVGFVNEPLSLNQFRTNIDHLKEKKFDARRKPSIAPNEPISSFTRAAPISTRPTSSRAQVANSPPTTPMNLRPMSSNRPMVHSPQSHAKPETKSSPSSSTDYSQELTIGIPDVETVLPHHLTPPSIMIKKTTPQSNFNQIRPATSPMISPRIVTIPPTSSSSFSSRNNSPNKSAPSTPNMNSPSKRNRSQSPERTLIRRSVSSLSPRMIHREVTMMHNLQRSPISSPARTRRNSACSMEDATQTSMDQCCYNPRNDEMTQTPNGYPRIDEMTQTSMIIESKCSEQRAVSGGCNSHESTPSSTKESPVVLQAQPEYKSWEELGIVDYFTLKDLKSGDFRLRSRAICAIEDALKSSTNLALVQPYLDTLLRSLLNSERHPDVMEDQRRVLSNLISRLPLENLEDRVSQIVTGLCRQGGPGSNLVAKNLMQRLPTAAIVLKLLSDDFLNARSSKFRENALQMVIFALLTFPSTYFDVANCVERTAKAALDRKKRVRQAALDVLAVLGQISSPKTVIEVVSHVAESRKEGLLLLAAVKARLARKQLPLVAADGEVQYALKIPTSVNVGTVIMFGSDVEWICSGSGSVSPTSMKSRSFQVQPSTIHGQDLTRGFEERRIADGLNRYAASGVSGTPTKSSPWSRIPVKNSSSSDDDHGYVAGTAIQSVQRPLESTGRFYGKLQSRSFPELSDAVKEKPPVRQLSENQSTSSRHGQTKLPVASTKFPAVETNVKSNTHPSASKNPYSFAPNFKTKNQRLPQSSDGVFGESTGAQLTPSIQLESRPRTHPPNDNPPPISRSTKPKRPVDQCDCSPKRNSAKTGGNELTIQPLTTTISLVESDDCRSEQDVVKTQPTSGKSRTSEDINNSDLLENYVQDQSRRTSGKTNSHILSDTDNNPNSIGSTPLHLSKEPTSSEIAHVRNEIAQIQSVIENVKKEMVQIQRQRAVTASPGHQPPSRPHSVNSNKTYDHDDDDAPPERPKTSMDFVKTNESPMKSRPPTAKSILKTESPFHRMATPQPDDVITDDHSSEAHFEDETHDEIETSHGLDEVDENTHPECFEPMTDSNDATLSKENELDDDDETIDAENIDYQQAFSPSPQPPEEITITIQRSASKVKRQAPLKRNHKVTPVRNPMPNIHQPSTMPTVMTRPSRVNSTLFPPSLRRFERPKDAIQTCLAQLDSSSWEDVMDGLTTFVRLVRHHPDYVDTQIHLMTLALSKHVKNLRSQVSRAACSASTEFFIQNAKALDADAEELAAALLNRTADTNKFLRGDALKALESMCDALPPGKVILILTFRGANHQNAAVRCTSAKLLNQVVFRIGCDKVFNMHREIRDRLILTGANLLMEGSLETRNYTKELFKQLSIHSHYQKLLLDVIPNNVYRNIEKALKSIQ